MAKMNCNTSDIGAYGELLVSMDLIKRNYEVFRAISPGHSCDLIISRKGAMLRVEVTKGHRNNKLRLLRFPAHVPERFDVMAVWEDSGTITYFGKAIE